MDITILKADIGDCIWLHWGIEKEKFNIIIDSGPKKTLSVFRRLLIDEIISKGEKVDLLILTHIDDDHIKGFLHFIDDNASYLQSNDFGEIWFNSDIKCLSSNHSSTSAINLSNVLNKHSIYFRDSVVRGCTYTIGDVRIDVIAPTEQASKVVNDMICVKASSSHSASLDRSLSEILVKDRFKEDTSKTNEASIAFVLTYKEVYHIAFLGDAHDKDVQDGLKYSFSDTAMDLVKLSHHGSSHNLSSDLIKMLNSNRFILTARRDMDSSTLARLHKKTLLTQKETIIYSNYEQSKAIQLLRNEGNEFLKIETLTNEPKMIWLKGEHNECQIRVLK